MMAPRLSGGAARPRPIVLMLELRPRRLGRRVAHGAASLILDVLLGSQLRPCPVLTGTAVLSSAENYPPLRDGPRVTPGLTGGGRAEPARVVSAGPGPAGSRAVASSFSPTAALPLNATAVPALDRCNSRQTNRYHPSHGPSLTLTVESENDHIRRYAR